MRLSTSTFSSLFSAFAIAERRTFSTTGQMPLFVVFKIVIASPAFRPRIRSTTKRAFCGETRTCLASALTAIVASSSARSLCRLGRLFGLRLVSLEGARGGELAQLVAHHVLRDEHRDVLPAVVHGDGVPDELRKHGGAPRPGPQHFLFVLGGHVGHLLDQVAIRERPFFERSAHVSLLRPICSASAAASRSRGRDACCLASC